MPTFLITAPDGKQYRVTGPEGSTAEQAMARVRGGGAPPAAQEGTGGPPQAAPVQPMPPAPAAAPTPQPFDVPTAENRASPLPPEPPEVTAGRVAEERKAAATSMEGKGWREKLNYGGTQPIRSLVQNVKQLAGQDVTRDIERSRGAMEGAGLPGMAGNVAGNIAMLGAPAGAVQKAIQTAPLISKLPAALAAATGAAGSAAAVEGLTSPVGEGETRGGNMAMAGATAGVLDAGLRGLGKGATRMFTPNADARKLLAEGVTPPLSTATDSKIGKGLGRVTEVMSTAVDESKAPSRIRADQQTVASMVRRADPTGNVNLPPGADIRSVTAAVTDNLDREYKTALAKMFVRVDNQFAGRARRIIDTTQGAQQESKDIAHGVLAQYFRPGNRIAARNFNSRIAPDFDKEITNLANSNDPVKQRAAKILREVQPTVRALRDRNIAAQGGDVVALHKLDDAYATAMRIKDASAASGQRTGTTAKNLNESVRQGSTKTQFARGEARDQDLTDTAADLVDKGRVGNPWFNMGIRGAGYGLAGVGGGVPGLAAAWAAARGVQSEAGHRFLLGQYGWQNKLADGIRRYAPGGAAIQQSLDTE
jgi:hypothetical protein